MAEGSDQATQVVTSVSASRDPTTGKFLKGQSGNPSGRPPSTRAKIGLNQTLIEAFVRDQIPAKQVLKVVKQTFEEAMLPGKAGAAAKKLVFEFFIQKPRDVEAVEDKSNSVVIRIENATFKATHDPSVIEGEVTEVTDNG